MLEPGDNVDVAEEDSELLDVGIDETIKVVSNELPAVLIGGQKGTDLIVSEQLVVY